MAFILIGMSFPGSCKFDSPGVLNFFVHFLVKRNCDFGNSAGTLGNQNIENGEKFCFLRSLATGWCGLGAWFSKLTLMHLYMID
uniref:Uncharacterized protein n=1 Tax=Arundo donax TaxID=35708 RepID=A0A0A9HPH2_ARUDO